MESNQTCEYIATFLDKVRYTVHIENALPKFESKKFVLLPGNLKLLSFKTYFQFENSIYLPINFSFYLISSSARLALTAHGNSCPTWPAKFKNRTVKSASIRTLYSDFCLDFWVKSTFSRFTDTISELTGTHPGLNLKPFLKNSLLFLL